MKISFRHVSDEIKKSALKELAQISPPYNKKIVEAVDELSANPSLLAARK